MNNNALNALTQTLSASGQLNILLNKTGTQSGGPSPNLGSVFTNSNPPSGLLNGLSGNGTLPPPINLNNRMSPLMTGLAVNGGFQAKKQFAA